MHDNPLQTHTSSRELSHSRGKAIQHTVDVGYYAPAARTTLNLAVFIVFLDEIDLGLANPRVHTLWARAGAFRHPAVVAAPRHSPITSRSAKCLMPVWHGL